MTAITDTRANQHAPAARLAFTTTRATLVDALTTVGLAVLKRPAVPLLGGALLQAANGQFTVSATDHDAAVTVRVPGTVHTGGTLLLDHAEITKLLGALVKGARKRDADALPLTVRTLDDGTPVVELGGYTMPVTAYPVEDYPPIQAPAPTLAQVDRAALARDLARVMVAVGNEPTIPMLAGINLEIEPGTVTLAGTDRYRLAVAPIAAVSSAHAAASARALVPGSVFAAVVKRFTGDRVRIGLDNPDDPATVALTCETVTVSLRTLTHQFPPYRQLIPETVAGLVHTDRAALLAATRRAAAVLDAKKQAGHPVGLTISGDSVSVTPLVNDHADAVTAPVQEATVAGITDGTLIRFHPTYLADALGSFTGDSVTLHVQANTNRPVLLTDPADGRSDPAAFLHLLMPIRESGN
ncbi:DNA polymerase III subunit beta [Saccharothrix sp. AJ9571]|nr:DNA polymerase III subunit beta [Saccharothrix sp. AJ9571]